MSVRSVIRRDRARPETDAALLERHRVHDGTERIRLLAELAASRTPVVLHVGAGHGSGVPARLARVDPATGGLELALDVSPEALAACRAALGAAGAVTGVAIQAGVKLQFVLDRMTPAGDGPQATLRAALPGTLVRVQRRDAYRIAPSPLAVPRLWLRDPQAPSAPRAVTVTDLSATGVSFRIPAPAALAAVGERLAADPLELPATLPIRCGLRVRAIEPEPDGALRVGCAFEALEPAAERALQVFVNAAQLRGRAPGPRIG